MSALGRREERSGHLCGHLLATGEAVSWRAAYSVQQCISAVLPFAPVYRLSSLLAAPVLAVE